MKAFSIRKVWLLMFLFIGFNSMAQLPVSFYQDSFNGGVTCGGWSPTNDVSGITGYFSIHISPGSTIHKAYLFASRIGPAPDITVMLNSLNLTFNASTVVTPIFQQSLYGGSSAVCAIDVSSLISDTVDNYSLYLPVENSTSDRYQDFYLYVAYSNPALPIVNTAIFLNQSNITDTMRFTPMSLTYPFVNTSQFAVSMFTGYLCDTTGDGEYIYFNSDSLGLIGGADVNSGQCGETVGSFYYNSDTLFGLNGDTNNVYMDGTDALSNSASLLPCITTSISSMTFIHQNSPNVTADNNIWGVILAYGSGCNVTATGATTITCGVDSAQLNVSPQNSCIKYTWSPGSSLSNDTIPNPFAKPIVTTTYSVIASFCNDTGTVVVTVNPVPLTINPLPASVCSGQSIELTISGGGTNYVWSPASTLNSSTGDSVVASPLIQTTYTVSGTDSLGCMASGSDVVSIISPPDTPTISRHGDTLISSAKQGNQWVRNDTTLMGATNQSYVVIISGEYKVVTENPANGCSSTSDTGYYTATGVEQLSVNRKQLSVYPNPTGGEINLNISTSAVDVKDWNLQITDVLGRTVYNKQSLNYNNVIDLSNEASGVYFICVMSKTGQVVVPVVKQ